MTEWLFRKLEFVAGWLTVLVFFVLLVFAANIEIKDLDLWFHIATGKYILSHHVIPRFDVFSCTINGTPWVNHEWLFQCLASALYEWGGFESLVILQVVVVGITFGIIFLLGLEDRVNPLSMFLLLLTLLVYQLRLTIRPDIFSILFLVLYVLILSRHLQQKGVLWVLAFIQILWTNMHGFFILGPGIMVLSFLGEWTKRNVPLPGSLKQIGRLNDEEYVTVKWAAVIVLLACLINPNGFGGLVYPFKVLFSVQGDSKIFFEYIRELQAPISFETLLAFSPYPAFRLLLLISGLSFLYNFRKTDIAVFALWLIFLLVALHAVRNIVFFSVIAYCVSIYNFQGLFEDGPIGRVFSNKKWKHVIVIACHVAMIMWMVHYMDRLQLRGYFDFDTFKRKSEYGGVSLRNYPYKAADFLVKNKITGNFYNDFNTGAYLLGRGAPGIKVFIDGRTEMYGAEFFKKYRESWTGNTELFDGFVRQYHLTAVLLDSVGAPAPSKMLKHLYESPEWKLVYFDYDGCIFLKDIPENRVWIEKFQVDLDQWAPEAENLTRIGIRKVTPLPQIHLAYMLYYLGFVDKAEFEIRDALRIATDSDKVYKLLGKIAYDRGDYLKSFEYFRKALLLEPNDLDNRHLAATILYQMGDLDQARSQCNRIMDLNPKYYKAWVLLAKVQAKAGREEEAWNAFEHWRKHVLHFTDDTVELGDLFCQNKKARYASEVYRAALETVTNVDLREEIQRKMDACGK